jgi:precorrin-3B methylase
MLCETNKIKKRLSVAKQINFVKMIYYVESKLLSDLHGELIEYVNNHSRVVEL